MQASRKSESKIIERYEQITQLSNTSYQSFSYHNQIFKVKRLRSSRFPFISEEATAALTVAEPRGGVATVLLVLFVGAVLFPPLPSATPSEVTENCTSAVNKFSYCLKSPLTHIDGIVKRAVLSDWNQKRLMVRGRVDGR